MKKTTIILFLAALMLIGGNVQAQGKKKIRITYRSAKRLVDKIEANPNAETLYLFRNGLDSLPEEIGQLKHLKKLVVSSNRLTYIPPVIGELTELEYISFKHNDIKALPPEIGQLKNLKHLELDYNDLQTLPDELCELKNLEYLSVTHNALHHLPNDIGKLESLEFFYIGTNLLQELPVGLAQLTNLVELNVAGSGGLLVVPNLRNCQRLERLYIDSTTLFDASFNPRTISRLEIYMVGR